MWQACIVALSWKSAFNKYWFSSTLLYSAYFKSLLTIPDHPFINLPYRCHQRILISSHIHSQALLTLADAETAWPQPTLCVNLALATVRQFVLEFFLPLLYCSTGLGNKNQSPALLCQIHNFQSPWGQGLDFSSPELNWPSTLKPTNKCSDIYTTSHNETPRQIIILNLIVNTT